MNQGKALKVLGMSGADISIEQLKKRYRELMILTHPDSAENADYPYEASEINVAYEYLLEHGIHTKEMKRQARKRKSDIRWNAPINENAYTDRDILHNVEDEDGNVLGCAVLDTGKFLWSLDEEFPLFLASLYQCSKNIIAVDDEQKGIYRGQDIELQAAITYLLAQQFVDSNMILQLVSSSSKNNNEYSVDAMLELHDGVAKYGGAKIHLEQGTILVPTRIAKHRLYVSDATGCELGYLSFKDDRMYYGIIPLFERRVAKVRIRVKDPNVKKLNYRRYYDIELALQKQEENQKNMLESINAQIDALLNLSCK